MSTPVLAWKGEENETKETLTTTTTTTMGMSTSTSSPLSLPPDKMSIVLEDDTSATAAAAAAAVTTTTHSDESAVDNKVNTEASTSRAKMTYFTGLDEEEEAVLVSAAKKETDRGNQEEAKETTMTMTTTLTLDALQSLADLAERELPSLAKEKDEKACSAAADMVDLTGVDSMDHNAAAAAAAVDAQEEKKEDDEHEAANKNNNSYANHRLTGFRLAGEKQAAKAATAKAAAEALAKQQQYHLTGMAGHAPPPVAPPFAVSGIGIGINMTSSSSSNTSGNSSSHDTLVLLHRQRQVVADLQMRTAAAQRAAAANPTTNILLQLYHQQQQGGGGGGANNNHQSYAAFLASLAPPHHHHHHHAPFHHHPAAGAAAHHHGNKPLLSMDLVEGYFRLPEHQRAKVFPQLPIHHQQQLVHHQQQQQQQLRVGAANPATAPFANRSLPMTTTTTGMLPEQPPLLSQGMVDFFFRLPLLQQREALVKLPLHQQEQILMHQQQQHQHRAKHLAEIAAAAAPNAATTTTISWIPPPPHQHVMSKKLMDSFFRLPLRLQDETMQTLPKHQQDQLLLHHCGASSTITAATRANGRVSAFVKVAHSGSTSSVTAAPKPPSPVDLTKEDDNANYNDEDEAESSDSNGIKTSKRGKQELAWKKYYEYCVEYKNEFHANDDSFYIPAGYVRPDGERVGAWAGNQRASYMRKVRRNLGAGQYDISQDRIEMLTNLGFLWTVGKGKNSSAVHTGGAKTMTHKSSETRDAQQEEEFEERVEEFGEALTMEEWRAREIAAGRATNYAVAGLDEDEQSKVQAAGKGKEASNSTIATTSIDDDDDEKQAEQKGSSSIGDVASQQPLVVKSSSNNEAKKAAMDGASWDSFYTQLAFFKAWKGHVNVPTDYVCDDEFRLQLGKWVTQQRGLLSVYTSRKKRNSGPTPPYIQRRIDKLTELGFEFEIRQYSIMKEDAKKDGKRPSIKDNNDERAKAAVAGETTQQDGTDDSDTETEDDSSTTSEAESSNNDSSSDDDDDESQPPTPPPAVAKKSHKKRSRDGRSDENGRHKKRRRVRTSWNVYYKMLLAFKKEHGHLRVPTRYEPSPGIRLGGWSQEQRSSYVRKQRLEDGTFVEGRHRKYFISQEKIDKLNAIGFPWDLTANKGNGFCKKSASCVVASPDPSFVEMDL